jgi:hypothetical protein
MPAGALRHEGQLEAAAGKARQVPDLHSDAACVPVVQGAADPVDVVVIGQVVDADHVIAALEQPLGAMGTDEAGGAVVTLG